MTTYTTRDEAIESEIIAALGTEADSHDIDAIADEVLTTTGEGVDYRYILAVDEADFWEIVEKHAK